MALATDMRRAATPFLLKNLQRMEQLCAEHINIYITSTLQDAGLGDPGWPDLNQTVLIQVSVVQFAWVSVPVIQTLCWLICEVMMILEPTRLSSGG